VALPISIYFFILSANIILSPTLVNKAINLRFYSNSISNPINANLELNNIFKSLDSDYKNLKEFADQLDAEFKVPITIYAAQAYDAMAITLEAIKIAKSVDAGKIADAVEAITYPGFQGLYRFSGADHRGLGAKALEMMQWDGTKFVRIS
jgi:ABC-type branched-subunit amino acid transport system substrate-binding protein